MPILQVDLSDLVDVQTGIEILMRIRATAAQNSSAASARHPLAEAMAEMKQKKIWLFLERAANLNVPEYSLPELGGHLGISSNKVCSLKAILAKPEQRLGLQFFETAPSGTQDAAGNPRYRMSEAIRKAIQTA
jgi:hypothetical protein